MLLSILTLQACSKCEPEIRYVDKPTKVYIPTRCIVPDSNCSFEANTSTGVISKLLECIVDMKRNEEACK